MLLSAFTVATLLSLVASPTASRPTSETCLACHDGTAAIQIRREHRHPWSVDYPKNGQPSHCTTLRPRTAPSGFGSTVEEDLLVNGRVECTSCHLDHEVEDRQSCLSGDRHDCLSPTSTPFRLRLLDGRFQSLCLGCHALNDQ